MHPFILKIFINDNKLMSQVKWKFIDSFNKENVWFVFDSMNSEYIIKNEWHIFNQSACIYVVPSLFFSSNTILFIGNLSLIVNGRNALWQIFQSYIFYEIYIPNILMAKILLYRETISASYIEYISQSLWNTCGCSFIKIRHRYIKS